MSEAVKIQLKSGFHNPKKVGANAPTFSISANAQN